MSLATRFKTIFVDESFNQSKKIFLKLSDSQKHFVSPRGEYRNVSKDRFLFKYIIKSGGEPAGFIDVYKFNNSDKVGFIVLAVSPKFQHKGIGKKLLDAAIRGCRLKKVNTLYYRFDNQNLNSEKLIKSIPSALFVRKTISQTTYRIEL